MSTTTWLNTGMDSSVGGRNTNTSSTNGTIMANYSYGQMDFLSWMGGFNLSLSYIMSRHFTKIISAIHCGLINLIS